MKECDGFHSHQGSTGMFHKCHTSDTNKPTVNIWIAQREIWREGGVKVGGKERRKGERRRGESGREDVCFTLWTRLFHSVWEELFQILVRITPREESSGTLSSCLKSL